MKKLLVLVMIAVLSAALIAVAGNVSNTTQKAEQTPTVSSAKTPVQGEAIPQGIKAIDRSTLNKPVAIPSSLSKPAANSNPKFTPVGNPGSKPEQILSKPADGQKESNDAAKKAEYDRQLNLQQQPNEPRQLTPAEKEEAAKNSPTLLNYLQDAAAEKAEATPYVEQPKWQPQYNSKGQLLNGQPEVYPMGMPQNNNNDNPGQPPVIMSTVFGPETFEEAWGTETGVGPRTPPGPNTWNFGPTHGSEGTLIWWKDDWHKYYYTTWSDTVAVPWEYNASSESTYNEVMMTPVLDLSTASACSIGFRQYYDDNSATPGIDSAMIASTTDGGATWNYLAIYQTDQPAGYYTIIVPVGSATTQVAFIGCSTRGKVGYWYIDKVKAFVDSATPQWTQEFNNWLFGNIPPTGWTIQDNGTPYPSYWNNNDFGKRSSMGTGNNTAGITYGSTGAGISVEYQNEWLVTPPIALGASVACTLSFAEYYSHSTSGVYGNADTVFHKISVATIVGTDTTWGDWVNLDYVTASRGSSSSKTIFKNSLNSYRGNTVKLAFNFVNSPDGSDNYYLDDVRVDDYILPLNEVASTSIAAPTFAFAGRTWPVASNVKNNGANSQTFQDSFFVSHDNKTVLYHEGFGLPVNWTGANPPTGWTVLDSGSVPGWQNQDWHQYYNSGTGDTCARVDYASGVVQNEWLISPSIDLSAQSLVHFSFRTYFAWEGTTDTAFIYGTTDNWATKVQIDKWVTTHGSSSSFLKADYDISSWAAGQANVKIAFKYMGNYDLNWTVDDAEFYVPLPAIVDYQQGETVTDLPGYFGANALRVSYATPFNAVSTGTYNLRTFTSLAGDEVPANDAVTGTLTVIGHNGTGGPDAGGYTYADNYSGGPAYNWIDISTIGTPIAFANGSSDDRYSNLLPFGFNFLFYGMNWPSIAVSENGVAQFDGLTSGYYSESYTFPSTTAPNNILAFLWDDLKQGTGNAYFYTNNADTAIIEFQNWASNGNSNTFTAEVILCGTTKTITYQYSAYGPAVATTGAIGIENFTGTAGIAYFDNNVPAGNVPVPPLAITFAPANDDIAVTSLVSPLVLYTGLSNAVKVKFNNNGVTDQNYDGRVVITDSTAAVLYDNTVTGLSLLSNTSATVDFPSFTPAIGATYTINVTAINPGDDRPTNNTLTATRVSYQAYPTGGPDLGYYSWIDDRAVGGPTFSWIDTTGFTTLATTSASYDDAYSAAVPMGGSFFFYGNTYTNLYVSTNGFITFDPLTSSYAADTLMGTTALPNNLIAFMWDDLVSTPGSSGAIGGMKYHDFGTQFVLWYRGYFYSTSTATFEAEVILDRTDNTIKMQYNNFGPAPQTDVVVGLENATGSTGLNYFARTNLGNYPVNGRAVKFFYTPPARDIALNGIVTPPSLVVNGASFTPSVRLANNGSIPETFDLVFKIYNPSNAVVYNQVNFNTTIAAGIADTIEFPATSESVNGAYVCSTYVAWIGSPDPSPANDKLRSTFTVDQHYGQGGPDGEMYRWLDNSVVGGPTFSWVDMTAGTWATFSNSDYGITPAIPLQGSFYYRGAMHDNVTLSADGYVTFDAITYSSSSNYPLPYSSSPQNMIAFMWNDNVVASAAAGARWLNDVTNNRFVIEYVDTRSYYAPSTGTVDAQIIFNRNDSSVVIQYQGVGADARADYGIGCENGTGTVGLNYYNDSAPLLNAISEGLAIKFFEWHPVTDVAMSSVDAPLSGIAGSTYHPAATVRNAGSASFTADLTVNVVGPAPATDIVFTATETTPVMAGGTSLPYTFTAGWAVAVGGSYTITVTANTLGDELAGDNTASGSATMLSTAVLDYSSTFEANNGGFTGAGQWQWGVPDYAAGPPVDSIPTPTHLWGTNLTGNYTDEVVNSLYSPAITLTGGATYKADFYMWHNLEASYSSLYDGANLKISIDLGNTWSVLTTSLPYDGTCTSTDPLYPEQVWSGYRNWTHVTVNLGAYAGHTVILRLDQASDNSANYAGVYIDNFNLVAIATDIAVTSLDSPGFLNVAGSKTITATVTNNGVNPVTMDSLVFAVVDTFDAVIYYDKLVSQVVAPGPTQYSAPTPWVVSTPMPYSVFVLSYTTGDGVPENDAIGNLCVIQIPRAFPHVEDMESLNDWWISYNYGNSFNYSSSISHSPTHSIYFYWSPAPSEMWLIGPPVTITGAIVPHLSFWDRGDSYWGAEPNQRVGIYLMKDVGDFNLDSLALWSPATRALNETGFDKVDFDLTTYIGHTVWPVFYFFNPTTAGGNWYVDDVDIYEAAAPAVSVAPATVDQYQFTGLTNTYPAAFTISNIGQVSLDWTATNSLPWIVPSVLTGSIPAAGNTPIDLTINTTGILGGMYYDTVRVSSNDPANPIVQAPIISVYVSAPSISVYGQVTSFVQETDFTKTYSSCFFVYNNGAGTLHWTATNTLPWVTIVTPSGIAEMEGAVGMSDITVNTTGIATGVYNDVLSVASDDPANPIVTVPLTITVSQIVPTVGQLDVEVRSGRSSNTDLVINNGSSVEVQVAFGVTPPESWLSVAPEVDTIPAGGSVTVVVTVNAAGMAEGTYSGSLTITSSNLIQSVVQVPINVTVTAGGCPYVIGDANGSGTWTGQDVTYGVRFFKGGNPPPFSCECTPGHTWYVSGDVNGSCSYTGQDVTRMVLHFKSGVVGIPCPDCPPVSGILKVNGNSETNGNSAVIGK